MKDILNYAMNNNNNLGLISLNQEKAFDRVHHLYLFKLLMAYGFRDIFILWVSLLYNKAKCKVKVARVLSVPIKVQKGIRQCSLSYQLYTVVWLSNACFVS